MDPLVFLTAFAKRPHLLRDHRLVRENLHQANARISLKSQCCCDACIMQLSLAPWPSNPAMCCWLLALHKNFSHGAESGTWVVNVGATSC